MKNVLILEDDRRLATAWREALEAAGYGVRVESNCDNAIQSVDNESIDIIVCDMLIRGVAEKVEVKGGLSFLAHLKMKFGANRPPIIAISGSDPDLHLLEYAEHFRANLLLKKPIETQGLVGHVNELLGGEASS